MYVIDAYNLLHALRRVADLPGEHARARARMVELLAHMARRQGLSMRLYFDGTPGDVGVGDHDYDGVRVIFCGPDRESADRDIRDFIANAVDPGNLVVISSDREVREACRLSGSRVMSSQEMARKLAPAEREASSAPEKPVSGHIGKIEQEMLDEIGDLKEFERRIIEGE